MMTAWLGPTLALAPAAAAPAQLDAVHAVDWRGIPLRDALDSLSKELGVPFLLDPSVGPEVLERRLRLYAGHLTGAEAFRWAARLAGAEAVFREDLVLIAAGSQVPRVWRLTGGKGPISSQRLDRLRQVAQRRVDVSWLDLPLSAVARNASSQFGIDVVFHQRLLADEPLVRCEQAQAGLETVCRTLEAQLKARTAILDGAVWVVPQDEPLETPATQPARTGWSDDTPRLSGSDIGRLERIVVIDSSVKSWTAFCDRIGRATGVTCRATPTGLSWPGFEGIGTAVDILESARLLGKLTWRASAEGRPGEITLEIRPGR
jgi:hypothetical protein